MNRRLLVAAVGLVVAWRFTGLAHADFLGIGVNVTGNTLAEAQALNTGGVPPDTDGSVGLNHYVEFTNGTYAVYNKTDGGLVGSRISDTQFWTDAGIASSDVAAGLADTRIVYDQASGHWFAAEITTSSTGNLVLVARSNTADPTQGFKAVSYAANGGFGDFPTLGLNDSGVFIATNNFTSSTGGFTGVSITSIPKADLLRDAPTAANKTTFEDPNGSTLGLTLQAAVDFGNSHGHGTILATSSSSFNAINQTSILNPAGPGSATLSATTAIAVQTYSDPNHARQPDGTQQIDANDSSYSATVYKVGDFLYAVHSILQDGHDVIRWTKINETTAAVVQEGTLSNVNYDYIFPSIAANAFGDVVIGFTRSGLGADGFLSSAAYVGATTGHDPVNGSLGFEQDPQILKAGIANYHNLGGNDERWGDFSATSPDPSNPSSFWTVQEFADANNQWSTQITQILVTSVPEPTSLALLAVGVAALAGRARRSRRGRSPAS